MYHDTHVHLDLLLTQLGLLPDRSEIEAEPIAELSFDAKNTLNDLIKHHDFLVQSTVDNKNAWACYNLFSSFDRIKILLGAHPEIVDEAFDVPEFVDEQNNLIKKVIADFGSKVVGFGECGLDYYYTQNSVIISLQKDLFRTQIQQALKYNLPLIIHCRDAFTDLFDILDEFPAIFHHFLVHCFTGTQAELNEVIKRGGIVGLGGICTFKNTVELQNTVATMPANSFVLETDLPFLAPPPHRGKTCLPEYVNDIAIHIAGLRNTTTEEIWHHSAANAKTLFGLGIA